MIALSISHENDVTGCELLRLFTFAHLAERMVVYTVTVRDGKGGEA
jgi:hypothetical protein